MNPIGKDFVSALEALDIPRGTFAIACSGGPDSMALALLAQEWAVTRNRNVIALTVDHGLRQESAMEAKRVGAWLKKYGIKHRVLRWKGKKPNSNVQELAREARYRLLAEHCAKRKITALLVAHTRDDQAETFLLRLARGSGVDGLSCMAAATSLYGMKILRPLLNVSKSDLIAHLKTQKQDYLRDPSNDNDDFDRVRMRRLMPQLAKVGLTSERLAKTASAMARARAELEGRTEKYLRKTAKFFPDGHALYRPRRKTSEEIALRALAALLMKVGGKKRRPRLADLERLQAAIMKKSFRGATLAGCILKPDGKGIVLAPEKRARR